MKKVILAVVGLCVVVSFAWAQEAVKEESPMAEAAKAVSVADEAVKTDILQGPADEILQGPSGEAMTLKGTIIDNLCAGAHKEDLVEFVKAHPKSCAVMPDCAASGYSLVSNGAIMKFDNDSSAKVAEFLKKEDTSLQVEVAAKKVGEELSLVSIANQK